MNLPAREMKTQSRTGSHWLSPVRWQLRVESGGVANAAALDGVVRTGAVDRIHYSRGARAVRMLNVLVALVGLVFTAPLLLAIAILVKLSSPGPVFYVQDRVGLDRRRRGPAAASSEGRRRQDSGGRVFRIYKFRTMVADSDLAGQVWASHTDPRITAVGQVLRKYRLDELPQLFNVLKGDMNIVGPRPEQPRIFQELRQQVSGYQERQRVLPGITGWAQVNHSYDQCLEDVRKKVAFDLEYIQKRSLLKDLKIMFRTLPVMIGKKGSI
ncbi:MAG TPA: sugar transferase [Longimicrobiales bacterium]|nr:sugar transferase [Longimicrobiales bacterium]